MYSVFEVQQRKKAENIKGEKKMGMVDRLFIEKGCPNCGAIRGVLNMEAVERDEFRGKDGQEFLVYSALSNTASIELLAKFGLAGQSMPVLVKASGDIEARPNFIIAHLRQQGMAVA